MLSAAQTTHEAKRSSRSFFAFRGLKISSALLALLASACTGLKTAPERGGDDVGSLAPVAAATKTSGASGILLGVHFNDPARSLGSSECRLRVENQTTKKDTFVDLKPGEPGVYEALVPGHYMVRRLGCGLGKVWNLEELFPSGFDVQPGRVSYLGEVRFDFKKGQLTTVRNSSRTESAEILPNLLKRAPAGAQDRLVSGFTDKAITQDMMTGAPREGFDVFALGVRDPDRILAPVLESLKTCGNQAAVRDPLRFGQLEYVAVYRQGQFVEIRDRIDKNAFSDTFRSCIEQALRDFQPNVPGEVRVRTRL